jgi:hypothetical protein
MLLDAVSVNPGRTSWEQEQAIADLLDAIDEVRKIEGADTTALRLAVDQLLGYWEAIQ